jgi:hypothetical protein
MQRSKIAITDLVDEDKNTSQINAGGLLPLVPISTNIELAPALRGAHVRKPQFSADQSRSIRTIVNSIYDDREDPTSDLFDEHIYISAQVHGWDYTREHNMVPARFNKRQMIDTFIAPFKDFATRLAIIAAHKIWKVSPTERCPR